MSELDEIFTGCATVWCWPLPHPADPERPSAKERRTRMGRRDATGRFEAWTELTSVRGRLAGGWNHRLTSVGERRPRELAAVAFEYNSDGDLRGGTVKSTDDQRARWSIDGRIDLAGAVDCNDLMTRGGPVRDSVERPSLAETWRDLKDGAGRIGALFRGGADASSADAVEGHASAESTRPRLLEVVPDELAAFDGWMRARQHREADTPAEAWEVSLDLERPPPGPIGLAVVVAAASTAHRRILDHPEDGLLFYLGS